MTDSDSTTGVAPVNGTQLHYRQQGPADGEPLVMIHAGICDSRMWAAQVAHSAPHYRVLTFDMRGFGQSPMVEGPFSFADDLRALLDHLEIDAAWLIGCSLGGGVALDLALTHPARVKGLVLAGAAIGGYEYDRPAHPLEAASDEANRARDIPRLCALEVQIWVDGVARHPGEVDPAVRALVYEMNLIPLNVPDAPWEQEREIDPSAIARLERIDKPALLIIGDRDIAPSLERTDILADRVAGAQKVVMTGTAHLPNMEQPAVFNQFVEEFLSAS